MKSEGYSENLYKDINGNLTGGFGHLIVDQEKFLKEFNPNWDSGKKQEYWAGKLQTDYEASVKDVVNLESAMGVDLDGPAFESLVEMRFNMGFNRLKGFSKMIEALAVGNYQKAADEMIDSKWHRDFVRWNSGKDTPNLRSRRLEKKMRSSR